MGPVSLFAGSGVVALGTHSANDGRVAANNAATNARATSMRERAILVAFPVDTRTRRHESN